MLEMNARFVQKAKNGWAEHTTLRYSCVQDITVNSAFFPLSALKETMRQAELSNWTLDATQMADLCSSINQFFTATGVIPPQSATHPQPQVQHPAAPSATQHPAPLHPKPSHHNQHGQHNQHIGTGWPTQPRFYGHIVNKVIIFVCVEVSSLVRVKGSWEKGENVEM